MPIVKQKMFMHFDLQLFQLFMNGFQNSGIVEDTILRVVKKRDMDKDHRMDPMKTDMMLIRRKDEIDRFGWYSIC